MLRRPTLMLHPYFRHYFYLSGQLIPRSSHSVLRSCSGVENALRLIYSRPAESSYLPSVRHQNRRPCDVARISALAFIVYIVQHYRGRVYPGFPIFNMDFMDSVQYHIKTLILFTKSDIKTVVIPVVCGAVCAKSTNT